MSCVFKAKLDPNSRYLVFQADCKHGLFGELRIPLRGRPLADFKAFAQALDAAHEELVKIAWPKDAN